MRFYRLIFLILLLNFLSCSFDETMNESYPGRWRSPGNHEMVEIGKTLVKNNIKVCGEYYLRKYKSSSSEFLIACTPDGESWRYFLVFTSSQEVMIAQLDNTIPVPKK